MDRIDTATKAVDLFGPGKHGFKNGDLALGVPPTDLNAKFFNAVQEELLGLVESSGQAPNGADFTQIGKAMKRFSASGTRAVAAGATALTIGDAGLILVDAGAGSVTITLPAANTVPGQGFEFVFYRVDSTVNTVTINRVGADLIDGETSFSVVGQFSHRSIKGNGNAAWATVSRSLLAPGAQLESVSAVLASGAINVGLNPTTIAFRSPDLTSGVPTVRAIRTALSLTVPGAATLGVLSAARGRVLLLAIDTASGVELAVGNLSSTQKFSEEGVISTVAIGPTATSADVVYSQTARANVPYRVVGCFEAVNTAGAWSAPSLVQGAGGLALAALSSLGHGPSPQVRAIALGVTVHNVSEKPVLVHVTGSTSSASGTIRLVVDGVDTSIASWTGASGALPFALASLVRPFGNYIINVTGGTTVSTVRVMEHR